MMMAFTLACSIPAALSPAAIPHICIPGDEGFQPSIKPGRDNHVVLQDQTYVTIIGRAPPINPLPYQALWFLRFDQVKATVRP